MKAKTALYSSTLCALVLALGTAYGAGTTSKDPASSGTGATTGSTATSPSSGTSGMSSGTTSGTMSSPSSMSSATQPKNPEPTSESVSRQPNIASSDVKPGTASNAKDAWAQFHPAKRGCVSKDELSQYSDINFEQADRNHNGCLSQGEFNKAWKQAYGTSKTKSHMSSSSDSGSTATQGFTGSSPSSGSSSMGSSSPGSTTGSNSDNAAPTGTQPRTQTSK